jgi:hypothetical protein
MPTVFRIGKFRFHFYSDEGFEPGIIFAHNRGIPRHEPRKIEQLVYQNHAILKKAFYDHHHSS